MPERPLTLEKIFQQGLRANVRSNSLGDAVDFTHVRPSEWGVGEPRRVLELIAAAELTSNSVAVSKMTPQVFRPRAAGTNVSLLVTDDDLLTIDESDFTLTSKTLHDLFIPANTATISTTGLTGITTPWQFVDFGSTWFLINDANILIKSDWVDSTKIFRIPNGGASPKIRSGCAFRGRMLRAGFDTSDYWLAAWATLWTKWMNEMGSWSLGRSGAPGPNWLWWSNIGGGDLLDLFLPNASAEEGVDSLVLVNSLKDPGTLYNLLEFGSGITDPESGARWDSVAATMGWGDTGNTGNFTLGTWAWINSTSRLQLPIGNATTLAYDGTMLNRRLTEGQTCTVNFSLTLNNSGDGATPILGGTSGTARTGFTGTQIFEEDIICGGTGYPNAVDPLTIVFTPTGTTVGLIEIRNVTLKRKIASTSTTPNDALKPKAWEDFEKNQSGFLVMDWQGPVVNTRPLENHVMVYGEDGISAVTPHTDRGLAISTFGLQEGLLGVGIAHRMAVGGNLQQQLFLDNTGSLWHVQNGPVPELAKLGFREYLRPLVDEGISITYDEAEKDFYISSDVGENFVLDRDGKLSVHNQRVYSAVNLQGGFVGVTAAVSSDTAFTITSNLTDFGYRGLKTVGFVQIDYEDISDLRLTVEYRVDQSTTWLTTPAIPGSEDGVFYVGIAAADFRFILTGTNIGGENIQSNTFAASTGWTLGTGATISGGRLIYDGTTPITTETQQLVAGLSVAFIEHDIYRVELDVFTGSGASVAVGDMTTPDVVGPGFYTYDIVAEGATLDLTMNFLDGTACTLETVSVKRVGMRISRVDIPYDSYDNRGLRSPRIKQLGVQ